MSSRRNSQTKKVSEPDFDFNGFTLSTNLIEILITSHFNYITNFIPNDNLFRNGYGASQAASRQNPRRSQRTLFSTSDTADKGEDKNIQKSWLTKVLKSFIMSVTR